MLNYQELDEWTPEMEEEMARGQFEQLGEDLVRALELGETPEKRYFTSFMYGSAHYPDYIIPVSIRKHVAMHLAHAFKKRGIQAKNESREYCKRYLPNGSELFSNLGTAARDDMIYDRYLELEKEVLSRFEQDEIIRKEFGHRFKVTKSKRGRVVDASTLRKLRSRVEKRREKQ
jgi:hypothetical protein